MKPNGLLTHAAERLSMTDREIARELGLSIATLRSANGPACPRYLRLALAALVADMNAEAILQMPLHSRVLPASSRDHPHNAAPQQGMGLRHAPIVDRSFDH